MEVGELFPAVQSAERAVQLSPVWAAARQTLGRSQLSIGEVHMVSEWPPQLQTYHTCKNSFLYEKLRKG